MSPRILRKELSFFGIVSIVQWKGRDTSSAAQIQVIFKNEKRKCDWENRWSVSLENGKLLRMTTKPFDKEELIRRNQYKTRITNVPKYAIDSLLLRQLSRVKAKSVYITNNRNGNQRKTALVYFESYEDLVKAREVGIYYYNTKLSWWNNIDDWSKENEEHRECESGTSKERKRKFETEEENNQTWGVGSYRQKKKLSKRAEFTDRRSRKHYSRRSSAETYDTITRRRKSEELQNNRGQVRDCTRDDIWMKLKELERTIKGLVRPNYF